jgi:putative transcriptional regulator
MLDILDTICYAIDVKQALRQVRRCLMKNKIENIRKEQGILQDEMAKALGVSRQTISSLENGRYNPSIMLAYKIAKYFGMTIEEVFVFEEEEL